METKTGSVLMGKKSESVSMGKKSGSVFISHSSKDRDFVQKLKEDLDSHLAKHGIEVWVDEQIGPTGRIIHEIEAELNKANIFCIVLSRESINSEWVNIEKNIAIWQEIEGKLKIIPILKEERCEIPTLLRDKYIIDLSTDSKYQEGLPGLIDAIKKHINPGDPGCKIDISRLQYLAVRHLIGRKREKQDLDRTLEDSEIGVVGIIADGGVGKSTFVYNWLNPAGRNSITHIFGWSFYDRENHTVAACSSDFFSEALRFFEINVGKDITEDEKVHKLFNKFRESKAILVLDGIEVLQYPNMEDNSKILDEDHGKFYDRNINNFLSKVLQYPFDKRNCLIVVTSREPLNDLENVQGYKSIELNYLNRADGAKLLSELGVKGERDELEKASEENYGHCLSLVLLGKLIYASFKDADIKHRHEIYNLSGDVKYFPKDNSYWRHASRIMNYYEKKISNDKERILLQMISLFHRPMIDQERRCLLRYADFAAPVKELREMDWNLVYRRLEDYGLLLKDPEENGREEWSCHPLVREYFRQTLHPSARKQAHKVLFEYFKNLPSKKLKPTIVDLIPLYRAVHHGCLAGLYEESLELYESWILQGAKKAYSTNILGAISEDVAALGRFFEKDPETQEEGFTQFSPGERGFLLARIAFCYTCLGRLKEAREKREEELALYIESEQLMDAASASGYISELEIFLGNLGPAKDAAEKAKYYADKVNDWGQRIRSRCRLATVYHLQGVLKESRALFEEAEEIQRKCEPGKKHLYSDRGFRYGLLQLDMADKYDEYKKILAYGENALDSDERDAEDPWCPTFALDRIIKAYALTEKNEFESAKVVLEEAYEKLKKSGTILYFPEFYLARAWFKRRCGLFDDALNDAKEALRNAEMYRMVFYQIDAELFIAQLNIDKKRFTEASGYVKKAERLVDSYTYSLRTAEIEMLKAHISFSNGDVPTAKNFLENAERRIKETGHNRLLKRLKETPIFVF